MRGSPQQQRKPGEIRVTTELVTVLASVTDEHGRPVPDLTQDAFDISEEGVPQKIERFEAETNRTIELAMMVDSRASTGVPSRRARATSGLSRSSPGVVGCVLMNLPLPT